MEFLADIESIFYQCGNGIFTINRPKLIDQIIS